jgi:hypothetical protein
LRDAIAEELYGDELPGELAAREEWREIVSEDDLEAARELLPTPPPVE